jgi:pimeloyl-ACP methyl ester carboxylesterase
VSALGLVHGAYHGSWCWERLIPELEARGHRAVTVDLPTEDPGAGAAAYAAACVAAFDAQGDDLIVVGHSLGGLSIPLVATLRPVRLLVFLNALYPRPGHTNEEMRRAEPDMIVPAPENAAYVDDAGVVRFHREQAEAYFFADCAPADAAWASARLRGQCWTIAQELTPLTAWPQVACAAIIGEDDAVIRPSWSRRVTRPIVGSDPLELHGGHAPYLARPGELAEALDALARR